MTELASGKLLLDEPAEGVARLTIRNPERRGALDHELLDALAEAARTLDARCLVIRGTGKVFSAGYDLGNLDGQTFEESAEKLVAHPFHEALEALEGFAYPVVGQLNGHTIGGGLELALTCDIRVAARGIKLGMPPAKLGLIYSHTGLRKFVEVCGVANTAELFYVGRNVDADRAERMGLVNQVVEPEDLERTVAGARGRDRRQRAAVAGRQQAHPARAARAAAARARRARAGRAARVLLSHRGLPRGRARLRGEAPAGLARALAERRTPGNRSFTIGNRVITETGVPTRERILDAAVELFGTKGFAGTSVGEIEQAAGLSSALRRALQALPEQAGAADSRPCAGAAGGRRDRRRSSTPQMLGDVRAELHVMGRMLHARDRATTSRRCAS